jgi:hypothetical protein
VLLNGFAKQRREVVSEFHLRKGGQFTHKQAKVFLEKQVTDANKRKPITIECVSVLPLYDFEPFIAKFSFLTN